MATHGTRDDGVSEAVHFVESQFSNTIAPMPYHDHSKPCPASLQSQQLPPGTQRNDGYHKSLVEGPPPGLVRVCPPTLADTRLFDNSNTTLFSDFAEYLDGGLDEDGKHVLVDFTCMICYENKLEVPRRVMPADSGSGEYETESMFSMIYQCGHAIYPQRYDPSFRRREHLPLTIPEDGLVPRKCRSCHEGAIENAIDELQRLLFPLVRDYDDLRYEDSQLALEESSMLLDEQAWNCWGMNIHYNRW
ncbi:hypothetical protein F5Y03DRAFT_395383 [Xylaria venustula]|nr:hypothetical protein F5Y03DRAFT_395383 [Xylaria venustula]